MSELLKNLRSGIRAVPSCVAQRGTLLFHRLAAGKHVILAILTLAVTLPALAAAEKRPNVVFVLTDDQRWDAMSCMGNPHLQTPDIDRLAAEGVLFRNHFCTTSLCSPSRASILGGLYAHAHGVVNNFTEYPLDLPTFPRQLQKAGYRTACFGKWHMGEDNYEKQFPYTPNVRAIRTDEWKYIHYPPGDGSPDKHMAELYHLTNDPEERHNLIGEEKHDEVVKRLSEELENLIVQSGAVPDQMPLDEGIKGELPDERIR